MPYADLSTRKVVGMLLVGIVFAVLVWTSAITWNQKFGTFSIPGVELQLSQNWTAWRYRVEFNFSFPETLVPRFNIKSFFVALGLSPAQTAAQVAPTPEQGIPVLVYHGVVTTPQGADDTPLSVFKAHMFALKAAGWQTVTMQQFVDAMQGKIQLPPKSFLLTFDDGRKDSYYPVDPILQALGYHAVMFLITGHTLAAGNEKSHYYMSENEAKAMLASGRWDIESHSQLGHDSYPINPSGQLAGFFESQLWIPTQNPGESADDYHARIMSDFEAYYRYGALWSLVPGRLETPAEYETRIYGDLSGAKDDLKRELGIDALAFAYPYNNFSQLVDVDNASGTAKLIDDVNQLYPVSFYQWSPGQGFTEDYPGKDSQLLRRVEPKPDWTPDQLVNLMNDGQPKALPFVGTQLGADGWRQSWGHVTEADGKLSLAADATSTGALSILDGTRFWKNYTFAVQFNWDTSQSISVIGHYQSFVTGASYISCNYSHNTVRIEETDNDVTKVIATATDGRIVPGDNLNAAIGFVGNYVECLWNGGIVTGANVSAQAPSDGGVAIETWHPVNGHAALTVTDVSAEADGQ